MIDLYVYALAGLLLGWIARDFLGKRKLDPSVIRVAQEQVEQAKAEAKESIRETEAHRERDRLAFERLLAEQTARVDYWMNRCIDTQPGRKKKVPTPPPPRVPEAVDIEDQVRLATGPKEGEEQIRADLLSKGLQAAEIDAILNGEYGDLPPGQQLDLFVQESIRDSTGLQ